MNVYFPDRVAQQSFRDFRMTAETDQHYGQLRQEVQTNALGRTQTDNETDLRRAAYMETGRGQNISAIV